MAYFETIMEKYDMTNYKVEESMISPILKSPINGEYSFVIMGDCSKEGWDMSEDFEKYRQIWTKQQAHNVQNIVIVNFSEGDMEAFCDEIGY